MSDTKVDIKIDIKATIELLTQKRDFVTNIFETTKAIGFTGSEEDIEIYINLIEKRQSMFEKISDIDKILSGSPHMEIISDPDPETLKQIEKITESIKEQSNKIIELDKKNQVLIDKSKATLTGQIKNVKQGKSLTNIYQSNIGNIYTKFDKAK